MKVLDERVLQAVAVEPHLSQGQMRSGRYFPQMDVRDFQSHFFDLQPVVGSNKREFGVEVRFRPNWSSAFKNDPVSASQFLIDNWFLFGFESLTDGRAVFLECTRDVLLSSFIWHLPLSTVLVVRESIGIDEKVLTVCRSLKDSGYRIALDDFESVEATERFLPVSHFIRVDFRHEGRRARAKMLRRLSLTRAILIAQTIESEEMFREAVTEGFGLFQGSFCRDASVDDATVGSSLKSDTSAAWRPN